MNTTTIPTLTPGTRVRIEKGCKARDVVKGTRAIVTAVEAMGADYSHSVRVTFKFLNSFKAGESMSFYARSVNRLRDPIVRMNDGNPTNTIEMSRA
jgi:hypothetical protein